MTADMKIATKKSESVRQTARARQFMNKVQTRRLRADDARAYRALLLEALIVHPDSFPDDYRAELVRPLLEIGAELEKLTVLGSWANEKLVAMGGCDPYDDSKRRHRGRLRTFYVKKDFRRKGVASMLLQELVPLVSQRVDQLEVEVTVKNEPVVRFFEKYGFRMFGITPRALDVDNERLDIWLLVRLLR